jgi:Ribbon-helix-helix protein, copG family
LALSRRRGDAASTPNPKATGIALRSLLANVAAQAPVLIAVDDVGWLDDSTLNSLAFVARRVEDLPIGLLTTLRLPAEEFDPMRLDRALGSDRFRRISLGRMPIDPVVRIVEGRLAGRFPQPATTVAAGDSTTGSTGLGESATSTAPAPLASVTITSAEINCAGTLHIAYDTTATPQPATDANHLIVVNPDDDQTHDVIETTGNAANASHSYDHDGADPGRAHRVFVVAMFDPGNPDGPIAIDRVDVPPAPSVNRAIEESGGGRSRCRMLTICGTVSIQYHHCMKTITVNVSEPVYEEFKRAAKHSGRTTSELIREAMESYRRQHLAPRSDLTGFRPRSLGLVLRPLSGDDDLLDEMLGNRS